MPVESVNNVSKIDSILDDRQLVIFKIAGEEFGMDINEVNEIIRWE